MGPMAPVVGQFPTVMAALILATDRKIVRRLRAAGAIDAGHAIAFHPPGPVGPARLRRMISAGAVREAAGHRYYLDETGFQAWRSSRRKRGLIVVGIMLAVIAMLIVGGVVKLR